MAVRLLMWPRVRASRDHTCAEENGRELPPFDVQARRSNLYVSPPAPPRWITQFCDLMVTCLSPSFSAARHLHDQLCQNGTVKGPHRQDLDCRSAGPFLLIYIIRSYFAVGPSLTNRRTADQLSLSLPQTPFARLSKSDTRPLFFASSILRCRGR